MPADQVTQHMIFLLRWRFSERFVENFVTYDSCQNTRIRHPYEKREKNFRVNLYLELTNENLDAASQLDGACA